MLSVNKLNKFNQLRSVALPKSAEVYSIFVNYWYFFINNTFYVRVYVKDHEVIYTFFK